YEEALGHYTEVRDAGGGAAAWRGMAAVLRKQGRYDESLAVVASAMTLAEHASQDLRTLWLERAWCLMVAGRFAEGSDAAQAGLLLASDRLDGTRGYLLL